MKLQCKNKHIVPKVFVLLVLSFFFFEGIDLKSSYTYLNMTYKLFKQLEK